MRPSRPPRKASALPDSVHHQLNMYALAAAAAGVGALALAQPAKAEIIYTKAHKHIGEKQTIHLDLNHDGITDFDLKNAIVDHGSGDGLFAVPRGKKNAVWGHTFRGFGYASALLQGAKVGSKGQFLPGSGFMAATFSSSGVGTYGGPWADVSNRFLGLKFIINGETHFGWARLNVHCNNESGSVAATLTGYAYETIANKPIFTGRKHGNDQLGGLSHYPGGLRRLAQGAKRRQGNDR